MTILDNVVVGTPKNKNDVFIDELDNPEDAPGPLNVIRHDGPIFLGDPDYWEVLP